MGKRLLSILGLLIAIVGIVFGGNLVLIIVGCVILGLGQMIKDKEESTTSGMDVIELTHSNECGLFLYSLVLFLFLILS